MKRIRFRLQLASDAEPGTGFGSPLVDDHVARDSAGRPVIRASHLKGLMRDCLARILDSVAALRPHRDRILQACFGAPGRVGAEGILSSVRMTDATAVGEVATGLIRRTALTELRTAAAGALRTTECVPAGTAFEGTMTIEGAHGGLVDVAAQLALLSIEAVGGQRSRGSGACLVTIPDRTPGALLRNLASLVRSGDSAPVSAPDAPASKFVRRSGAKPAWFRLVFQAEGPICCPEIPDIGGNVLRSGFTIPASAVQGGLLTLLSELDENAASQCLQDRCFRTWPLLPIPPGDESEKAIPWPVRVSLSHKVSKLPDPGRNCHFFQDALLQSNDRPLTPSGSPLKAADGVLLRDAAGQVRLWRASDMPRTISAHAVHSDPTGRRNLYTVEAMAPMVWSGILSIPDWAAELLVERLKNDPLVAFGKARSVRGYGRLSAERLEAPELLMPELPDGLTGRVFIVQSPIAVEAIDGMRTAAEMFKDAVQQAGWGPVREARATVQVRFGWNRRRQGRTPATICVMPGSVVVLERPLDKLAERLVTGIGARREEGFGALLPHPGIASDLIRPPAALPSRRSANHAARIGYELWEAAGPAGPSPSQIAALIAKTGTETNRDLLDHVRHQKDRPGRIWRRWEPVAANLEELFQTPDLAIVRAALRVWHDLAVSGRELPQA